MTRDESPPPAYDVHDPGSNNLDLEEGVGQNEADRAEARASPAPFVASRLSPAPSRPGSVQPAPPRADPEPIPLQPIRTPSVPGSSRSQSQPQLVSPRRDVPGGVRAKSPFADRGDSDSAITRNSLNWWRKNGNGFVIFFLNVPFLVMFIMDIIGTHGMPWSTYYRYVVHSGAFRTTFIMLGFFTAAINSIWALTNCFHGGFPRAVTSRKLNPQLAGHIIMFTVLLLIVWPIIEVFGIQRRIQPIYSCEEMGFRSSILLDVLGGVTGISRMSQFPNNITIRSGNETLGLSMSPTIHKWNDNDRFSLTPLSQTTTPDVFHHVASYEVTIFLSDNIHQFRRIPSEANDTIVFVNGTFTDDPNYYLSFPALSPPMHSTTKANWTYMERRPWVELVSEKGTVLKTVKNQRGDRKDTMMRMCGAWSVTDMVEDLNKMEGVLVGLARMMIEMMKWGLDY